MKQNTSRQKHFKNDQSTCLLLRSVSSAFIHNAFYAQRYLNRRDVLVKKFLYIPIEKKSLNILVAVSAAAEVKLSDHTSL